MWLDNYFGYHKKCHKVDFPVIVDNFVISVNGSKFIKNNYWKRKKVSTTIQDIEPWINLNGNKVWFKFVENNIVTRINWITASDVNWTANRIVKKENRIRKVSETISVPREKSSIIEIFRIAVAGFNKSHKHVCLIASPKIAPWHDIHQPTNIVSPRVD